MEEGMVQIGRFEIRYAVTSLKRFSASLWESYIKILVKIFGYLQHTNVMRESILSPQRI